MRYSKFSRQFNPDSGILRLMEDLGNALSQDGDIQMLGGGNPASIPEVEKRFRAEMERLLADGREFERAIGNYDAPQGNRACIEALSDLLRERLGWAVNYENIAITNGSQASFGVLFNLFAGEWGDGNFRKIGLPITPEYIGYAELGLGEQPIFSANKPLIDLLDEQTFKYRVDFDRLNINADAMGAVCISRPTNPSGNVVTDDDLAQLGRRTRDAGVPLIVDGAYGQPFPDIVFSPTKPLWDDHIIFCLSLSKLGLPGVRTGIIIANADLITQITRANAIFNLAPGRFGPALVTRLLRSQELLSLCSETIAPYYRERSRQAMRLVRESMADLPVRIHRSEGAIFLWLWFPDLPITSETLYQRLKKRGVLVIAGQHFFPGLTDPWRHRDECIRITYTAAPDQLRRGIQAIAEEVRHAYAQPN